ncbi:hypothetical protein EJ06DRAFT_530931 [Trichodelitschia bisporula]|uniref:Uncharacterized protein n=1 Tax=Trichodelitschia bisporula TaxID=703511 RepID=A0A6G1HU03_9PEZI|nr:hypothetical protein EJ06DRAFT_530931 [Trichodelitschia bisporula]
MAGEGCSRRRQHPSSPESSLILCPFPATVANFWILTGPSSTRIGVWHRVPQAKSFRDRASGAGGWGKLRDKDDEQSTTRPADPFSARATCPGYNAQVICSSSGLNASIGSLKPVNSQAKRNSKVNIGRDGSVVRAAQAISMGSWTRTTLCAPGYQALWKSLSGSRGDACGAHALGLSIVCRFLRPLLAEGPSGPAGHAASPSAGWS